MYHKLVFVCLYYMPRNNTVFKGYFDGSSAPTNPGNMGAGALIKDNRNNVIASYSRKMGWGTNNMAEWLALLALLNLAIEHKIDNLIVYGDSALVINQARGKYRVKSPRLKEYKNKEVVLKRQIKCLVYSWIPRKMNHEADKLSTACFKQSNEVKIKIKEPCLIKQPKEIELYVGLEGFVEGLEL